jgi:hypothetical protein
MVLPAVCRALLDWTAGGGCPHACIALLDLAVGEGFQFFDDLLQPATALGVVLLRWQRASLLGILLIESLDVTDFCLQQVDTAKDRFSSVKQHVSSIR